jgi:hypothetical protein
MTLIDLTRLGLAVAIWVTPWLWIPPLVAPSREKRHDVRVVRGCSRVVT